METVHDVMEAPAEATFSSLGKRKAETQGLDESGGSGEGEIEKGGSSSAEITEASGSSSPTESMAEDSSEDDSKEWEWGYDSFEGLEYESPRDNGFSDDESYQKFRRYMKQYYTYKGFYIDPKNIQPCQVGGISPYSDKHLDNEYVAPGKTKRQQVEELAKEAVQKYNQINGTNVTFEKLVRVNISWSTISRVYITLLVKENPDKPDEPSVEYQAKVQKRIGEKYQPIFCRPAPFQVKRIAD